MASIQRRGNAWRVRLRVGATVLTKTCDTEAQAVAWADAQSARIAGGQTVAQVQKTPPDASVAMLFDRYAREISPMKRGGRWEVIRLTLISRTLVGIAAEIDGATIAEWQDARLQSVAASTVNRELTLISHVFTIAQKKWRLPIKGNPVSATIRPKMPKGRTRRVSDAERDAIAKQLGWDGSSRPELTSAQVAWVVAFAIETAMRKGEILGMKWRDVYTERSFVHLPITKNGDERNVPLSPRALALIGMLRRGSPDELVMPVLSGTLDVYFRRASRAVGLLDLHFHDTRHEATTRLAQKIKNPMDLARMLGHRNLKQTMEYYHPDAERIAEQLT